MKKAIRIELVLSEMGLYKEVVYHYHDGSRRVVSHFCNNKKEPTLLSILMDRCDVSADHVKKEMDLVVYDIECLSKELMRDEVGWWEYSEFMDDLGRLERLLEDLRAEYEIKRNR